jgi:hypothetical protein
MDGTLSRISRPRCILLYALAPPDLPAAEANRTLNEMVADPALPLALFHDHFIGAPGGVVVFYAEDAAQRAALASQEHLAGWDVALRPLVFSFSPAAFDEQIAFTLRAYGDGDWEQLRREQRPRYGDPGREAETAEEDARP